MDPILVDTSALYALLDADDAEHLRARRIWEEQLVEGDAELVVTSYVVAESFDLVRRRLGFEAVRSLDRLLDDGMRVVFVDEELHDAARARFFSAGRRALSLVDCSSIALAQERGIKQIFAFDAHFEQAGLEMLVAS